MANATPPAVTRDEMLRSLTDTQLRAHCAELEAQFLTQPSGYGQWWISKSISAASSELLRRSDGRTVREPAGCAACASQQLTANEFGVPDDVLRAAARPGLVTIRRVTWSLGTTFLCRACGQTTPGITSWRDDASVTVWRLRDWDDETLQQAWLDLGVVCISEDLVGDMGYEPDRDEIRRRLRAAYPGKGERTIGIWAGYWSAFLDMVPGDLVIVPLAGGEAAIGEVRGAYDYIASEPNPRLRHRRQVRWLAPAVPRAALPDDIRRTVNSPGTICRVGAEYADFTVARLAGL